MPYFVTLEGIEGAGKSTLRSKLSELVPKDKLEVVVTREPGATDLGRTIRSMLLDPYNQNLDPVAELLLFAADRAQHLREVVRPALKRGALVICDRYIHSTLAYQGYGRGLPLKELEQLNELTTGGLRPDLVLLLDLDPQEGLRRAKHREQRASGTFHYSSAEGLQSSQGSLTRFEDYEIAFHQKVCEGFLALAKDARNKITVLDAQLAPEQLAEKAAQAVRQLLAVR